MPDLNEQLEKARFDAWVKEDRIPPIQRKHHWKTWLRALGQVEQEARLARRQHGSAAQAVASDCRATCDVCFDEVGNEWPCVKDKARARIAAHTRASDGWTKDAPTEQAWYWHWNGDEDCAPFPLSVMWSGTAKKCFVAINQLDPGTPHWCDEYGGYWLRIREPSIDAAMQQAASNQQEGAK